MTLNNLNLTRQLQFLQQIQHYAQSGTAEDCESLKDLFNTSLSSIQEPCLQIQLIHRLLPMGRNDLYYPDKIILLAKEGIEFASNRTANLSNPK